MPRTCEVPRGMDSAPTHFHAHRTIRPAGGCPMTGAYDSRAHTARRVGECLRRIQHAGRICHLPPVLSPHNNPLPSMEHCVADWPADAVWQSVLDVESWIGRCSSARRSMVYSMPRRASLHSRGTGRAAQERPRGAGQPAGLTFILVEDSQILVHALDVVGATVPEHDIYRHQL